MNKSLVFKILTFIFVLSGIIFPAAHARFEQETFKTHLRWSLDTDKPAVSLQNKNNTLIIKTLDNSLFNELSGELAKIDLNKNYFKKIEYTQGKNGSANQIKVDMKDESIELFSFYKDKDKKYVLDFWINKDLVVTKKAAVEKKSIPKVAKIKKAPKKKAPVKRTKKVEDKITQGMGVVDPEKVLASQGHKGYKDFRYGASFIWNYEAFIPPLEQAVNLSIKGPDYFYEIKDREFANDDKKEAHMQLSINFYKEKKWGLMTRSINLFQKKYGMNTNRDIIDFMKATSMIKNTIKETVKPDMGKPTPIVNKDGEVIGMDEPVKASSKSVFASAISILQGIVDRTQDYELKRACFQYMLQYNIDQEDYIQAMQTAKELYVAATEQFDDDMIIRSSRVILFSLAHLNQVKKMKDFLSNKAVIRVLPAQEGDAYIGYVNLKNQNLDQVIAQYTTNVKSYTKPVHPAILYNTAESYFRKAQYERAIKLFDEFSADYSYTDVAGFAHLRIALSYDLLDKDPRKTLKLYETAINRSVNPRARMEAKIRYVGLRVARKNVLGASDLETTSFLDATTVEKKKMDGETRKLLWLVRLRALLNQGKYNDALAYLSSVPLDTMKKIDRRTFHADGAEIVLGLIKSAYLDEDYAKAVKVWEVFKDKYINKVAKSAYLRFIVTDSFLKLGLMKSYVESAKELEQLNAKQVRTFPRWVKLHKNIDVSDYITELKLAESLQTKNWAKLDQTLESIKDRKNVNYNYYKGLVSYHNKAYDKAVSYFENLLIKPNLNNILNPNESLMMLTTYAESLYQSNDHARFRKNAMALVSDLRKTKTKKYQSAIERIEYLTIESISSERAINYNTLSQRTSEFLKEYDKSEYKNRVKYLNGLALVNTAETDLGKKVLEELINDKETPEYIKGLARTELSSLALKNKTL
tara:strand:+ start:54749 stop:57517 length:2769 start_codon:yes stop_codon:yes gene_type:complete